MQDPDSGSDDGLPLAPRAGFRTPMRAAPPAPAMAMQDTPLRRSNAPAAQFKQPALKMPATFSQQRATYEDRARANNRSLTPLRQSPPTARPMDPDEEISPGDPLSTAPAAGQPEDGSIDMLAYGKANNIARPAGGLPQSESNDPLAGGKPAVLPGQSVPAHVGGTGPLARNFSNPTSAAMYHSMVQPMARKLFGAKPSQPISRTGLRASRSAVA